MTLQEFVIKWEQSKLTESAAAQEHFLDLCALLGEPTPATADPDGTHYTFERGARKTDGGEGWADVWKKGFFGWEYKGKRKDLAAAYRQLLQYHEALDSPPLLVVCDFDRFEIHTKFTNTVARVYSFDLKGLASDPQNLDVLRRVFTDPQSLKPGTTREIVTKAVAERIGQVADSMRARSVPADRAAHFLMRLMFCMFAEDIGLLPAKMFSTILDNSKRDPARLARQLGALFSAMTHGGDFGAESLPHFNGGLFKDAEVEELDATEIQRICDANIPDWADVEPSIFGTLFERLLDPEKRSQIGAHYTSYDDIKTIVEPVVMEPLRREWTDVRAKCEALWPKIQEASRKLAKEGGSRRKDSKPRAAFDKLLTDFVHRLAEVRILDPACGSGNFLYVAINMLLDLEKEVTTYLRMHGVTQLPQVRPTQLAGIEINRYAQELAQVVIWIGYLQWMHHNGFNPPHDPVLDPIDSVQCRDAILDLTDPAHPSEPEWPEADFIVGNPPFLGTKMLRGGLGDGYVSSLFSLYGDRIPGFSDLCCYWFEKARAEIAKRPGLRVGLLATQAIRNDSARRVLERIKQSGDIFFAVSDREWFLDGAAVHISMIAFTGAKQANRILDGLEVAEIHANLTAGSDVGALRRLIVNQEIGFVGDVKGGPFDIDEGKALEFLHQPAPVGLPTSDVIRPYTNGLDVTRRSRHIWIIDFGTSATLESAARFGAPFEHVAANVKSMRAAGRPSRKEWWLHMRPCPSMRRAVEHLPRFLATPSLTKYRLFVWMNGETLPDHQLVVFGRSDDYLFGLLHSRLHEFWALSLGTRLETRPRYTPTTCFETFPLPEATDTQREAISSAAHELNDLRSRWLDPPEWTHEEITEFPGSVDGPWRRHVTNADAGGIGTVRYPRLVANDAECAKQLAKRTLTNLYNERPTWLDLAHRKLDEAVFAAYGWAHDMTHDQILERLLALNMERAANEKLS